MESISEEMKHTHTEIKAGEIFQTSLELLYIAMCRQGSVRICLHQLPEARYSSGKFRLWLGAERESCQPSFYTVMPGVTDRRQNCLALTRESSGD